MTRETNGDGTNRERKSDTGGYAGAEKPTGTGDYDEAICELIKSVQAGRMDDTDIDAIMEIGRKFEAMLRKIRAENGKLDAGSAGLLAATGDVIKKFLDSENKIFSIRSKLKLFM